jgi:methionyl aminopeptidase
MSLCSLVTCAQRICVFLLLLFPNVLPFFHSGRTWKSNQRHFSCELQSAKGFGSIHKSFPFSGNLRPGKYSPIRSIPNSIVCPTYTNSGGHTKDSESIPPWHFLPTPPDDIEKVRRSCKIAREVLDEAVRVVRPGITTDFIDQIVHHATIDRNSYPSPLRYKGFPKSCCTSINEVMCHGIPDSSILQDGDIVNIDVTIFHDGVHGDCSETVPVGNVKEPVKELIRTSFEALQRGIEACKPGVPYNQIGSTIEEFVTRKGFHSAADFCGHG